MRLRQMIHLSVGIVFWSLLGLLWWLLMRQGEVTHLALVSSSRMILGISVLVAVVTLAWVAHNLRIHSRKGTRNGTPNCVPRLDVDRLGKAIVWDCEHGHREVLQSASYILIKVDDHEKRYLPDRKQVR